MELNRRYYILILMMFLFINCKNEKVEWQIKSPIGVQYIYELNDDIYCWSKGFGLFTISDNGKIEKQIIFEDERKKINFIKTIPAVGVFGCYREDNNKSFLVEILNKGTFVKFAEISDLDKNPSDFLISNDKKSYLLFIAVGGGMGYDDYPNYWRDAKSNARKREVKYFNAEDIYFLNNKYFKINESCIIYNEFGFELKRIRWKTEYINNDIYYSCVSVYGKDECFYIISTDMKNGVTSKYYILKLDKDLNLIGKRLVRSQGAYKGNCVSGIYVDKTGNIYTVSDKEMSVTKFIPIEKGEDSFVNLKYVNVIK